MKQIYLMVICMLAVVINVGCVSSGIYVINVESNDLLKIDTGGEATIPRPMGVADDDRSFWVLCRNGDQIMKLQRLSVDGCVLEERVLPVYNERYAGSDIALSSDGEMLAYTGVRPSRVDQGGHVVGYDSLLYVVALKDQRAIVNGLVVPECSSGDLFWVARSKLVVLPAATRANCSAELFDLEAGRQVSLFPGRMRLRSYPSLLNTKVAIIGEVGDGSYAIIVYSLSAPSQPQEFRVDAKRGLPLSIAWADESIIYYSQGSSIYRLDTGTGAASGVVSFDGGMVAYLHAVDYNGSIHFSLSTSGSAKLPGDGWFVLDVVRRQWKPLVDLRYIRDVLLTRDRRYIVVNTGM